MRHCSAEGQHKDSPLTTVGMRQAHLLSNFFNDQNISIHRIISSPYLRAIESIKPYAQLINTEVEVDERLKERILSEDPIDDWLEVLEQSFTDLDFTLPGGESANDAMHRVSQVIDSIYDNENVANVIIVSHGNLLSLLLKQYNPDFGFANWKELRNPDVFLVNMDDEKTHSVECVWR
ncbi:histidine phosphatase family protein [Virgibacillus byunsanensis]|uniref:Histidine phosphatase family protein n=1 Tax=Virgibacillus byunsanensis TaxID=570945 RepID=A0ABW3LNV9_9BACI